jgi:hypothetical protein
MNVAYRGPFPEVFAADALLMDVARRIQLTKTKHQLAEQNFAALCKYVDREGSPLQGLVVQCYPSGSFATGTAIASRVKTSQHDVDVVIELNIADNTPPQDVLKALFDAIIGDENSRYHGKVKLNSRCVTVSYEDGTTVDLMPIARFAGGPERAGHLFHYKQGVELHKPVNPWGFADHFNRHVEADPAFQQMFKGRRLLVEGGPMIVADAATDPMPEHENIEEKSPRVVALQLIKRNRDIAFRQPSRRELRKPPSVALAAIALEAGPVEKNLVDEVVAVANAIRVRLQETNGPRGVVHVLNPAYQYDVFTDRWPENIDAQHLFDGDLHRLTVELRRLKTEELSLEEKSELLKNLFGESAASYAIESQLDAQRHEMEANRFQVGPTGKVVIATIAAPAVVGAGTTAARTATRAGDGILPE